MIDGFLNAHSSRIASPRRATFLVGAIEVGDTDKNLVEAFDLLRVVRTRRWNMNTLRLISAVTARESHVLPESPSSPPVEW